MTDNNLIPEENENISEDVNGNIVNEEAETVTPSEEYVPESSEDIVETSEENVSEVVTEITEYQPETVFVKPEEIKDKKKRHSHAALWTVTVICLLISISSTAFSLFLMKSSNKNSFVFPEASTPSYETASSVSTDLLTVAGVAEKVNPSTVMISAEVSNGYQSGTSMGSGFFMTKDGIVITNHHVIENAVNLTVTTYDGTEYPASLVGSDDKTDVAVLQVEGGGNFVAAEIGDSSKTKVGDQVVAIGTPYSSTLQNTVTAGYVSAIRNNYRFSTLSRVLSVFQHDAAINSGNSGGPLCNMYGQVIGINSVKVSSESYENIGFAIQIQSVASIITELINNGSVDRPMIGITASTDNSVGGAYVQSVTAGSPADAAGIKRGDIITKVDGLRVYSIEEVINYFSSKSVGDTVDVVVLRDAESQTIPVKLFSTKDFNDLSKDQPQENEDRNQNENNNQPSQPESGDGSDEDWFDRYFGQYFR